MAEKRRVATKEEKLTIVKRQKAGETIYALARETGWETKQIREWMRLYRKKGEAGLEPRKKLPGVLLILLMLVFAAVFVFSLVKILQDRSEREAGHAAYNTLVQSVVTVQQPQVNEIETTVIEGEKETLQLQQPVIDVSRPSVDVDFDALQAINPQIVAWICSDSGDINYPIVRGTDNEYYLNRLVDGTVNRNGSIFMDFRNQPDFADRNTFIYGHNMLDGTMFASLSRYSEAGYYEQHPELLLVTPERSYSLQVFAGCVVPGNSDIYQLAFHDEEDFSAYLDKVLSMSEFTASAAVTQEDRIVTLSTCAYRYEDARYVLFCKLMPMQ